MKNILMLIFFNLVSIYSLQCMEASTISLSETQEKKIGQIIKDILENKQHFLMHKLISAFNIQCYEPGYSNPFGMASTSPALYLLLNYIIEVKENGGLKNILINKVEELNNYFKMDIKKLLADNTRRIQELQDAESHGKVFEYPTLSEQDKAKAEKSAFEINPKITELIENIVNQNVVFTLNDLFHALKMNCYIELPGAQKEKPVIFNINSTELAAISILLSNLLYAKDSQYVGHIVKDIPMYKIEALNDYFKTIIEKYQEILDQKIEHLKTEEND